VETAPEKPTEATTKAESGTVDSFIEETLGRGDGATTVEFAPPPRPSFIADELGPEHEGGEVYDELEEVEPNGPSDPAAKGFKASGKKDIDSGFYAGGLVDFYTFVMCWLLGMLNGEPPETYDINEFGEAELTEAASDMMASSGRKFTPGQRFFGASAIIWGRPLVTGIHKRGKQLIGWFRKRKERTRELERADVASPVAQQPDPEQVTVTREQAEQMFAEIKAAAIAEAKAEAAKAHKPTKAETVKADKPKTPVDVPSIEGLTPRPVAEMQKRHKAGLCAFPGCDGKVAGKGGTFCGNPHRIAYQNGFQQKGWPNPKEAKAK